MKTQKITKSQEVAIHTTSSTDPEETKARQGRAERMAAGKAKWDLNGRRIDKNGQKEK